MNARVRGRPLDRNCPNRSALRAPQGCAPGQAGDKEKKQNEKQKGDTSNEIRKGHFKRGLTNPRDRA
jgi:hypothetical protein